MRPVAGNNAKPDRSGARARRMVISVAGLVAVVLLVAGCGGSSPSRSPGGSSPPFTAKQFVAFAVCMRSHGVPDYPDPQVSISGNHGQVKIGPGRANPRAPAFESAGHACSKLLPNGGRPAGGAQDQAQDLTFAECIRSHGVPSFPDADRHGTFTLPATINQQAPQFQRAVRACATLEPSSLTINQARPGGS